jgi:hypothetical protein
VGPPENLGPLSLQDPLPELILADRWRGVKLAGLRKEMAVLSLLFLSYYCRGNYFPQARGSYRSYHYRIEILDVQNNLSAMPPTRWLSPAVGDTHW